MRLERLKVEGNGTGGALEAKLVVALSVTYTSSEIR